MRYLGGIPRGAPHGAWRGALLQLLAPHNTKKHNSSARGVRGCAAPRAGGTLCAESGALPGARVPGGAARRARVREREKAI